MGLSQRQKGLRREREFAQLTGGKRVPLSGAAGGEYTGDVKALGMTWEVKARAAGFRELYKWLDGSDALALKADRQEWLVVLPYETLRAMLDRPGSPGGRPRVQVPVHKVLHTLREGASVSAVAREFGVSRRTVNRIRVGRA
ncbi:MAG: helix-turn-helix domain-containing protein [Chloroflexi bacterium]|nr:helix-turn-helix domain-containing protein [Chloroflexota bacterium]